MQNDKYLFIYLFFFKKTMHTTFINLLKGKHQKSHKYPTVRMFSDVNIQCKKCFEGAHYMMITRKRFQAVITCCSLIGT